MTAGGGELGRFGGRGHGGELPNFGECLLVYIAGVLAGLAYGLWRIATLPSPEVRWLGEYLAR